MGLKCTLQTHKPPALSICYHGRRLELFISVSRRGFLGRQEDWLHLVHETPNNPSSLSKKRCICLFPACTQEDSSDPSVINTTMFGEETHFFYCRQTSKCALLVKKVETRGREEPGENSSFFMTLPFKVKTKISLTMHFVSGRGAYTRTQQHSSNKKKHRHHTVPSVCR